MDKIDEWMKREVENEKAQSPSKEPVKNYFKKGTSETKKITFSKSKTQTAKKQFKKPYPQKVHGQPHKQVHSQHKQEVRKKTKPPSPILKGKLKIIPLGGLNEVGKNMMALEYENDIIILDMGFEFPSEDLLGIDYVIPDVTYLEENKNRIRGVLISHGHLDHIGGIPYILPKLGYPPIYATKLTLGLIKKRTEEFKQEKLTKLREIKPDEPIKLGRFLCKFFRVMHSIPDAVGMVIETPVGKIVNTGDFKFDESPARNLAQTDMNKIRSLGKQNVLALFCESTNALKPGHSMSEREVRKALDEIVKNAPGRLIIASFSSQIGRIQQVLDAATKYNKKVFVSGRSMRENIKIAANLGYLKGPQGMISDIKKYKKIPDKEALILTTGSQGESVSALTRMANGDHPHVNVKKGDTIVFSSSPIIGNEKAIFTVINNLTILGANVIHNQIMDVHTSGHGKQDELKKMINMVNPKYLVPIHGEYYMRQALADLAKKECNIPEDKIIMLQNGDVLIAEKGTVKKAKETIDTKYILIDGRGEGHVGSQVQTDRALMSQNGALVILVHIHRKNKKLKKTPDVVSRGFIYMSESKEIAEDITKLAGEAYKKITQKDPKASRRDIKNFIKQTVDKYTRQKLERRPLIIPLIIEN